MAGLRSAVSRRLDMSTTNLHNRLKKR